MNEPNIFWPLKGLAYFLVRPGLWLAPIMAGALAWIISLGICAAVLYLNWPASDTELSIWQQSTAILLAAAYAIACFVALWIIAIPFIIGMALEKMVIKVLAQQGHQEQAGENMLKAMASSMSLFMRGLPWRMLWLSVGIICSIFLPPLGILISAVGLGHTSMIDASEIVLTAIGLNGQERKQFYRKHRIDLLSAGLIAGLLSLLLAFSFFGLLFWLPAMLCAAAITIPHWVANSNANTLDSSNTIANANELHDAND